MRSARIGRRQLEKRVAAEPALAFAPSSALRCSGRAATQQSGDERHDEQHEEYEEQDLGDAGGASCDAAETKQRGDEGDDEEDCGVVEHGKFLFCCDV